MEFYNDYTPIHALEQLWEGSSGKRNPLSPGLRLEKGDGLLLTDEEASSNQEITMRG